MNTTTATPITLSETQQKRLEDAARLIGKTPADLLNGLVQEHLEELLEDMEDGARATEITRRMRTGETRPELQL